MSKNLLDHIKNSKELGEKLLAILLDPDKLNLDEIPSKIKKINAQKVDFIFVGGSTVDLGVTELCVSEIRKHTTIPILLFPGDYTQLTNAADGVLFLSLLSGQNPEYLVNQHVKSADFLFKAELEIISTGYILIDGGIKTAIQKVSNTLPILQNDIQTIKNIALAAQFMGKDLVYLEAGSGATIPVDAKIIKSVSHHLNLPLIVGGGIRSKKQLEIAYKNGADLVVIGTAFEENENVLIKLKYL